MCRNLGGQWLPQHHRSCLRRWSPRRPSLMTWWRSLRQTLRRGQSLPIILLPMITLLIITLLLVILLLVAQQFVQGNHCITWRTLYAPGSPDSLQVEHCLNFDVTLVWTVVGTVLKFDMTHFEIRREILEDYCISPTVVTNFSLLPLEIRRRMLRLGCNGHRHAISCFGDGLWKSASTHHNINKILAFQGCVWSKRRHGAWMHGLEMPSAPRQQQVIHHLSLVGTNAGLLNDCEFEDLVWARGYVCFLRSGGGQASDMMDGWHGWLAAQDWWTFDIGFFCQTEVTGSKLLFFVGDSKLELCPHKWFDRINRFLCPRGGGELAFKIPVRRQLANLASSPTNSREKWKFKICVLAVAAYNMGTVCDTKHCQSIIQ